MARLRAENLRVSEVFGPWSAAFEASHRVCLLGPNGAGKTTMLAALAGLHPAAQGELWWDDVRARAMRPLEASQWRRFLPQSLGVPLDWSVATFVRLCGPGPQAEAAALALLQEAGLQGLAQRRASSLSGGEWRRVQLAWALGQAAPCVFLDEPTGNLDPEAVAQFARDAARFPGLVVWSTHDLALARTLATHVVALFPRGKTWSGTARAWWSGDGPRTLYASSTSLAGGCKLVPGPLPLALGD